MSSADTLTSMDQTRYGRVALRKFGAVPDGFHIFSGEWLGEKPEDWTRMRVKGAQFDGKNRRIPRTIMTTIVTREEIAAEPIEGPQDSVAQV